MFPTGSSVEGMVPSWWCYWKVEETLGGGAYLEEVDYWEHVLERCIFSPVPFLHLPTSSFSLSLPPVHHDVSHFVLPHALAIMLCLTKGLKQWSQVIMDGKLQCCEPK